MPNGGRDLVLGVHLHGVVGDEKQRRRRSGPYNTRSQSLVNPVPSPVVEESSFGLESGLDSVNGEERQIRGRSSTRSTLHIVVSKLALKQSHVTHTMSDMKKA